ncbi:MAG: hypothetical protein ACRD5E_12115 [Nitrososphaeraceae archaeon]
MAYNPSKGFPADAHLRTSRGHSREARINHWLVVGLISAREVDVLFKNGADMLSNEFGTRVYCSQFFELNMV